MQIAAALMLDVLEGGADYIRDNRPVWPQQPVEWALTGIHWQIVNAARIVLNSVRTVDFRVKFCEEAASWPTDATNGDPASYVDTFIANTSITEAPGEKFSWVDPGEDPPIRVITSSAYAVFDTTTNVEAAPVTAKLLGRAWLNDIPG